MLTFQNEDAYAVVEKNLGWVPTVIKPCAPLIRRNRKEAVSELKERRVDFLPFPQLEAAVKSDVEFLKTTTLVPDSVTISGWVYEVETGKTRKVV